MQRNNTNITSELYSLLKNYNLTDGSKLHYYQELVLHVFKNNISKGICINHHMGSGKSITAVAIMDHMLNEMKFSKIFFISPVSLKNNMVKAITEYNEIMGTNLSPEIITFISKSHTMAKNVSKHVNEFNLDHKLLETKNNLSILDKALIIFEEAHLVMQLISNGSPGAVALYELIMRSPNIRIIMLTGTIINSRPFELAPMMNLLSGKKIFPETEGIFLQYFWDTANKQMLNKNKFQNRIFGLVSRIDASHLDSSGTATNYYPKLFDMEVIRVPMSKSQLVTYMTFREIEVQEALRKKSSRAAVNVAQFSKQDKKSSTYRVRTRQISTYPPPSEIEMFYRRSEDDITKLEYTSQTLIDILAKLPKEQLESPKFFAVDQLIKKHANQKGIIHSPFTGVGGAAALGYFLESHGYTRLGHINGSSDYDIDTTTCTNKTFALLNASVNKHAYKKIFDLYNSAENNYGKLLPIIILADREALGLDLKCVRYGIMLSPVWIYSLWDQFVHRMKRYKSHLALKPVEQDCQPYMIIACYPADFNIASIQTNMPKAYERTTDETIFDLMMANKAYTTSFSDACYEVSIECQYMKEKFPEMTCRACAPNNAKLYTDDNINPPYKTLGFDINEADPCQQVKEEEIDAREIIIDIDGQKFTFYYVLNPNVINGAEIYYHNASKNIYERLLPSAPSYNAVLAQIIKTAAAPIKKPQPKS